MQPFPANNATNITNTTYNSNVTPNGMVNNTTRSKEAQNQDDNNNLPILSISSEEAKELAKRYTGPGTILGKPVRTTYKKIHAWQVPVYTREHKFLNNIYIDAKNGRKID
jgi:hypothetical protein